MQVFKTFAQALLADLLDDDDEIEGVSYEHLFRLCRERFLVSSDTTLRTHLTEFKDHELLKTRKGPDGIDMIYIPLPAAELVQLVEHLEATE
jgi:origin recognition complex subunit 2